MERDLRLLPLDYYTDEGAFSLTILNMNRESLLFEAIEALPHERMPVNFDSWCGVDFQYGATVKDDFGDRVQFVRAADLLTVDWSNQPAPVLAYVRALEPDTRIALYWH